MFRDNFQEALKQLLGARYAEFETLSAVEKTSYVLGSENWEDNFDALLHLVKEFIVAVWEVQKHAVWEVRPEESEHTTLFQHWKEIRSTTLSIRSFLLSWKVSM